VFVCISRKKNIKKFEKTKNKYGSAMASALWFRLVPDSFLIQILTLEEWIEASQYINLSQYPNIFEEFIIKNIQNLIGHEKDFKYWHEIYLKPQQFLILQRAALNMMLEKASDYNQLKIVSEASPTFGYIRQNALFKIREMRESL